MLGEWAVIDALGLLGELLFVLADEQLGVTVLGFAGLVGRSRYASLAVMARAFADIASIQAVELDGVEGAVRVVADFDLVAA